MSKFIVSSSALLKVLTPLVAVISNNPVVPILENFLFVIQNGVLQVTASDLEVSLVTSLPIESREQEARLCVPSRILLDLLKQLPDQPITITFDEETRVVSISSSNGRYNLSGEDGAQYPRIPVVPDDEPLEMASSVLSRAIANTLFATSTDELRPAMTGVLWEMTPTSLTFVATDGHRLLRYRRTDLGAGQTKNVIIPRKGMALLKNALSASEHVKVRFSSSNAHFDIGTLQLTARVIDERYPDYYNVIPIDNPNKLIIDKSELLRCVKRVSLMANRTTHQVRFQLSGSEAVLSAEDLDFQNEARETLSCQYDGEAMTIGFNAKFLQECLSVMNADQVLMSLSIPSRAGLFAPSLANEHEDVLMLVMPVMLNNYV